ncbi:uncharacterized protein LOC130942995 [Arachis stenosperma]|uniref:uncharacterized protein LOC130942995 n=1 Tax=Arachis stenosperma TaxID=217475 RepID=UPI0025AD14F2|nr:uncharacterized protein LOC130942995 [Arachis stenosperma]
MLSSLQLLCFYKQPPLCENLVHSDHNNSLLLKDKRLISNPSNYFIVHAVKEDSQQYEVDPDKAREALQKLDQEIQSLSNKPISSPKVRVSDMKISKEEVNEMDQKLEITDSLLTSVAGGLVLLTIFYNTLFYTVIKPSIDGSP